MQETGWSNYAPIEIRGIDWVYNGYRLGLQGVYRQVTDGLLRTHEAKLAAILAFDDLDAMPTHA